ncbi:unnamed protein product, partial [Rotaria sp. Silwood1]
MENNSFLLFLKKCHFATDIGANLTDGMYQGVYGSSKKHDSDLDQVIKRAFQSGLDKIIITAGTHHETIQALELCSKY